MLYFITDAAGHSGSVTTRKLINTGKQVRAPACPDEKHTPEKAEAHPGDIHSKERKLGIHGEY